MVLRATTFGFTVPLLLAAALLCVSQSPLTSASATRTISATINDADSGNPLSNAQLEVQLFPHEHEGGQLPCVPSDNAQPLFTFAVTTGPNGSFSLAAQGGGYVAKITIPHRQPIFGCLQIDTEEYVRSTCGAPALHQRVFIRTATSIPEFSGDIVSSSVCAPWEPSPCTPLRVPNLVKAKKIMLLDPQGNPIGNSRLEFRENTMISRVAATRVTDALGIADVSTLLQGGGLLRMSVGDNVAYSDFLIQFANSRTQGRQKINFFNWRCKGDVMHGVMVQP
jgi:hypothetical protein